MIKSKFNNNDRLHRWREFLWIAWRNEMKFGGGLWFRISCGKGKIVIRWGGKGWFHPIRAFRQAIYLTNTGVASSGLIYRSNWRLVWLERPCGRIYPWGRGKFWPIRGYLQNERLIVQD